MLGPTPSTEGRRESSQVRPVVRGARAISKNAYLTLQRDIVIGKKHVHIPQHTGACGVETIVYEIIGLLGRTLVVND